jgi:hypothetical protein
MNLFGPDPEEERKEIISDALELYIEIVNAEDSKRNNNSTAYINEYKKILKRLDIYFRRDILSSGLPDFLRELMSEFDPEKTYWMKSLTEVKTIEMGLRKILKKFKVELPEKTREEQVQETKQPLIQNVFHANQSLNNEINITNEIKIEIDQAINELKRELDKPNPNPSKIKNLFEIIKKGLGYGAVKALEILLKKMFGIDF